MSFPPDGVPGPRRRAAMVCAGFLLAAPALACGPGNGEPPQLAGESASERAEEATTDEGYPDLAVTLRRATELADSIEDLLRPVPLMRPADIAALRRYSNAENLVRARALGARPSDEAHLQELVDRGELVRLEDSTEHWVLRRLRASAAYVTPDTRVLLQRLGADFQERLQEMGLPPFRFEISSILRTAEGQAALRRRNPNAAAGTSAHEFGTTVDIDYSSYAAPMRLPAGLLPEDAADSPELERVARVVLERVAGRKSRELQAILGEVMRDAQAEGIVLVTLEQQQPVYHITVARALAD